MAFDDGLTARERARIRRARKRAGIKTPAVRGENASDKARAGSVKVKPRAQKPAAPIRGESAADKAKAGRQIRVEEDGSILYPNGTVRDAETKKLRPAQRAARREPTARPLSEHRGRAALRYEPSYAGEKPAGMMAVPVSSKYPTGMRPVYQSKPTSDRYDSDAEAMADLAMDQLKPALDRTPKLAKGVQIAERVGESLLPLSLLDKVEGRDLSAKTVALDAAFMFPGLRGTRSAGEFFKAMRAGLGTKEAAARAGREFRPAKPPVQAAPRPNEGLAGRKVNAPAPRKVSYGEHEAQFPNSPAVGTRMAQRLLDRASETVGKKVDVLRASDSRVARGVGKVITPVSARARVPKQAGKHVKQTALRKRTGRAQELRDIKEVGRSLPIPGIKREPAQIAHWWLAQVPKAHRTPETLRLIKNNLDLERQEYVSGAFSARVEGALRGLQAKAAGLKRGERVEEVDPDGPLQVGDYVEAGDRGNFGRVESIDGEHASVHFVNAEKRTRATVTLPVSELTPSGYRTSKLADDDVAANPNEYWETVGDIQRLKDIQADIPERIKDLSEDIAKLDKTVKAMPKIQINDGAIDAMRLLMDDRKDIFVRAGKLDPEDATNREGLVSRWLGLESDGTEVYVGHRLGKTKLQRPSGLPGGVSLGRTSTPAGIGQQNTGQLIATGRARKDLMGVIEDWQAAQVYEFHNLAKDELGKMGQALTSPHVPNGYALVNPKGHAVPRTMTVDKEAQALAEGIDPEDVLIGDVKEYLDNYLAVEPGQIEKMLEQARSAGHLEDLRLVPTDVVRRYYSQFLPTKIQAATPGIKESTNKIGKFLDITNDALYLSLIYSNPGYVPAAMAANAILTTAQQGALLTVNLPRAVQLLTAGPARTRDFVRGEVGGGIAASMTSSDTVLRDIGGAVSTIGDEPWRIASFIHEAARVGVLSKTKPYLDEDDFKALDDLFTKPQYEPLLNDITDRAVQAVLDFNRQGSMEKALAKRALFVWGFLRAAARYPGRFAVDHPVRTAAGAGLAYAYQDDIRGATMDDAPSWMSGAINAGTVEVDGKRYPRILPTRSFDPSSPPAELFGTATGDVDARTFLEMFNPLIQGGIKVAGRDNPSGFDAPSYRESAKENAKRLVPWYGLGSDLINPPDDPGMFPEDASRLGRLKRAARLPVAVDPEEAKSARDRELSRKGRSKPKTIAERRTELLNEERVNAKKLGLAAPTPEVMEAVRLKAAIEASIDTLERQQKTRDDVDTPGGKRFKLTARQKAAAALQALRRVLPADRFDYAYAKANLDSITDPDDVETFLDSVRRDTYGAVLEDWHRLANDA